MINVSSEFRRALAANNRNYLTQIDMTLADGTVLHLDNTTIWSSGCGKEDAVSSDESFSALGSAVVGSYKFTINNLDDSFSTYVFEDATLVPRVGLELSGGPEMVKQGTYTVDEAVYNGSTITLTCLDNMHKFDKPYSDSTLAYPASLDTIVRDLCSVCGVNLATSSLNFPRKDFVIPERPSDEATTCREVLSWCATIAGCFAKCNTGGDLELKWFNTDAFGTAAENLDGGRFDNYDPSGYTTGDTADGGAFNPWETGDAYDGGTFDYSRIHILNSLYSQTIAVDDVVVTQVQAEVKVKSDTGDAVVTYSEGRPGYAIKISGNEFINETNAQNIVSYLGLLLIGLTFRKANVSHSSDPTIEAGDCAFVYDRKGNRYNILVTRTNFTVGSAQTTVCGADTPARNSATRFTEATKSYVELRKKLIEQKSEWEQAVDDLSDRLDNASGLYPTDVVQQDGSVIHYLHDKPVLEESDIRIVVSNVGIAVTANGTDPDPAWYGLKVDGQLIASILNAIGVNADWIHSGTLKLGGDNNTNGLLEVYNASNKRIGRWDNSGIYIGNIQNNLNDPTIKISSGGKLTAKSTELSNEFDMKTYHGGNVHLGEGSVSQTESGTTTVIYYPMFTFYEEGGWSNGKQIRVTSRKITVNDERPTSAAPYSAEIEPRHIELVCPIDQSGGSSVEFSANSSSAWFQVGRSGRNYTGRFYGNLTVYGALSCTGTKPRLVKTKDYDERFLYCYETPSPLFGDVGEGTIGDDGKCYVMIDSIFAETVTLNQYQVFLQKYGDGDCWVSERKSAYFIVEGTPGLSFGWELKAKQSDFDQLRLESLKEPMNTSNPEDYADLLTKHINRIKEERTVNAA